MLKQSVSKTEYISVVYLAWLPYGVQYFKLFIQSYIRHQSSFSHYLIIAFNGLGFEYSNAPEEYLEILKNNAIIPYKIFYFQSGQDIEIYQNVAKEIDTEYVLFLNTYSEIKADNWLQFYAERMNNGIGMIGASGSFQSYYSAIFQKYAWKWEKRESFLYNFRKYKLFIKNFFYWRFLFRPFPNPHVRTNAFMVRPKEFLKLNSGKLSSKFKAYLFENGRKSLTNYYLKKGLKVLVLDKFGNTYEPDQWSQSSTFWINNQENLLISDNQTRLYDEADEVYKKLLTKLAWGINE